MKQIIEKIGGLYDTLVTKLAEVDTGKKELVGKETSLKETEDVSNARVKDLNSRETAVKHIESVETYSKEADSRIAQANASLEMTNTRITSFTAYEDSKKKEITAKEEALNKRETEITKREQNLEQTILDKVTSILKK